MAEGGAWLCSWIDPRSLSEVGPYSIERGARYNKGPQISPRARNSH